MTKRLKN